MLHQIAADGFVAGSVHDARRGDERQNAALAERIQSLDEEIVVNGLERLSSNRVVALPKGCVENPGITEGNIGRYHVEITVIGRFDGLETVDDNLLSFPGQCREHLSGQQVFLEREDFDFAVGVVERAYAGYPDKTANRAAEYGALKERLRSGIASGRDTYDAVAEYLGWFDDSHLGTEGVRAYRPKSIRRPSDYAARMECYDPQFTHCRVDGETYLIRFPSCDLNEEQTAWVRTAVRAYLASGCENLILDIRGNGGGSDSAYEPLLRLLYDHEGAEDAMEYRVSDLAVAHVREFAGDTERGRGKIARMERTPAGEFLTDGPKTYRIHYDSVSPRPRRVGLLIDGKVGSSGEQLVLEVRASSRRTTVYGQDNTLGCLDFSNCEILYFPQDPTRWMMLPTTRSCRVPEGRGIDSAGIAPDVRIPLPLPEVLTDNVDTWTLWVAEDMKTEKRKE